MPRTACLTADELSAFHQGDLPEAVLEELAAHLEGCSLCETAARALDGAADPVVAAYRQSALAAPLPVPAAPPARVGPYEILGEVGRGGMGVVYRARHRQLPRDVALKMLLGGAFADGNERARFRAEAEAVARLQHPHIVQIYEVGEHEVDAGLPRPYFTLEFVDGGNLAARLAGRPQPPRQAAAWVEVLARAAHYAHERGIVHRDLKPSNVLLTAAGEPKICDFGVAKLLTGSDVKTQSGTLVGTAEYMAPEQASGEGPVGPAADVYALGALLYTALTGRPPFQGTSPLHTLLQVRHQEPVPPRRLQPQVPRDLDTVCLKGLEKDPKRRYASAADLAEDLRRFLADEPIKARRPSAGERLARWVRHHKAAAAALAAVAAALVATAVVSTLAAVQKEAERAKAREAETKAVAALRLAEERRALAIRNLYVAKTNLTGLTMDGPGGLAQVVQLLGEWRGLDEEDDPRGWEWFYCQTLAGRGPLTLRGHTADAAALAWSPDGRRLASGGFDRTLHPSGGFDGTLRIWDAATGRQLLSFPAPWGVLALSWSPDGKRLASANWWDKTVGVWDPAAGKEMLTLRGHPERVFSAAFSPDGCRLASADDGGCVIVWDAAAGTPLLTLKGAATDGHAVCWSPDGRRLATSRAGAAVAVWDAAGGQELATLKGPAGPLTSVRWSPDGRRLAGAAPDGSVTLWDADMGAEVGRVPTHLVESYEGSLCWSPDGRRLAAGCRDLTVRVWDPASGEERLMLRGHTGSKISTVAWSPDGTCLASGERGWNAEVKVWRLDTPPQPFPLRVGARREPHLEVRWSPKGRKLATAHQDGTVKIWEAATGRPLAILRGHTGDVWTAAWSPDGRRLASGGRDATVRVWDAEEGRLLATFAGNDGPVASVSWSPDGQRLACGREGAPVTVWDVATGSKRVIAVEGYGPAWAPDGDRVAAGGRYKISLHDPDTGRLLGGWQTSFDHPNLPVWSPDGRRVASVSDYAVEVHEAADGRARFPPLRHTQPVDALAWSPDGKQLAAATRDGGVHLWDAVTGDPILTLRGDGDRILSVAWSPDGTRLAFAGAEGAIKVWDAAYGYEAERAPALLPPLDRLLAARPEDREALRLRAGVHARRGAWDKAAADAERLLGQGSAGDPPVFQAGWWVADAPAPGSPAPPPYEGNPFGGDPDHPRDVPRWYLAADDHNGYVPVARGEPYYLTRVYAPIEQVVDVRFEAEDKVVERLWVNGARLVGRGPTPVALARGWNTLVVRLREESPSSNLLFRPRMGFYLRLGAPGG
jgi:WD40 repeat protein